MAFALECSGGCGKSIINGNVDLSGTDVTGAICPECAASHTGNFEFDANLAGWSYVHPAPPPPPAQVAPVVNEVAPVEVVPVASMIIEVPEPEPKPAVVEAPAPVAPEAPTA